jgi:hypothetical protein
VSFNTSYHCDLEVIYAYDANGNTKTVSGVGASTYSYDPFNRLVGANGNTSYYVNLWFPPHWDSPLQLQ